MKHIKESLLEGRVRLWRLERRAHRPVLLLIQDVEEYRAALARERKTAKLAVVTKIHAVSQEIRRRAAKVDQTETTAYKQLAAGALKAVTTFGDDVEQLADSLKRQKTQYLTRTDEALCPLCEGKGFHRDYDDCPVCRGDGTVEKSRLRNIDLDEFKLVQCKLCGGKGHWKDYDECPVCGGEGELEKGQMAEIDISEYAAKPCKLCKGKGHYRHYDQCPECGGSGEVEKRYAAEFNPKDYELVQCPACKGRQDYCQTCDGHGEIERRYASEYSDW